MYYIDNWDSCGCSSDNSIKYYDDGGGGNIAQIRTDKNLFDIWISLELLYEILPYKNTNIKKCRTVLDFDIFGWVNGFWIRLFKNILWIVKQVLCGHKLCFQRKILNSYLLKVHKANQLFIQKWYSMNGWNLSEDIYSQNIVKFLKQDLFQIKYLTLT